MKEEITIPEHFPEISEEKLKAEAKRREDYSIARDLQAEEDNKAIERRLKKDKEKQSEDLKEFESENEVEPS
jgi:hypothetical protein